MLVTLCILSLLHLAKYVYKLLFFSNQKINSFPSEECDSLVLLCSHIPPNIPTNVYATVLHAILYSGARGTRLLHGQRRGKEGREESP